MVLYKNKTHIILETYYLSTWLDVVLKYLQEYQEIDAPKISSIYLHKHLFFKLFIPQTSGSSVH